MNLLGKVTKGPYSVVCFGERYKRIGYIKGQDKQIGYAYSDKTKMCVGEANANAQLLAASYDHALILSAVSAGNMRYDAGRDCWVVGAKAEGIKLEDDPFFCPILTDELRTELERLMGVRQ